MTNYSHFHMPSYFLEHLPNTPKKERNFITDYYEKSFIQQSEKYPY